MRIVRWLFAWGCVALFAWSVSASTATRPSAGITEMRALVARALPAYYGSPRRTWTSYPRAGLAVACASPCPGPESTYTPPYARLFLVRLASGKASVIWSEELGPDNGCKLLSQVGPTRDPLFSVVCSPYAGSIIRYHFKLFRYNRDRTALTCVLETGFVDGSLAPLPRVGKTPLAFLVCEPLEKGVSRYRGRMYAPTASGRFHTRCSFVTTHLYRNERQAYGELKRKARKKLGDVYVWPKALPNLERREKNGVG